MNDAIRLTRVIEETADVTNVSRINMEGSGRKAVGEGVVSLPF